ncbi:MAG TPA: MATE family efflux transporter [Gemmataceae bacterium]
MDDHQLTDTPSPAPLAARGLSSNPQTAIRSPQSAKGRLDLRRPTWYLVLVLAVPALLQQMLVLAVSLSDRWLAGHAHVPDPDEQIALQAAQTTANYLAWFISSYTVLVGVGSTALVARCVGAGNRRVAVHVTNQSLLLGVVLGLAGSLLALLGLPALVAALQLHGEVARLAVAYLQPLFALLVFQVIEAAGIACLVGAGDTVTGLWIRAGVAVFNVPLAWGFFHGFGPVPAMGFVGIALGTAVSNVLGASAVVAVLLRGRAGLQLKWRQLWPDPELIRRLLRVSVPAAVDSLSVAVGQLWFLSIINHLDDAAKAAHGIALQWEALGYLSGGAFGTAAMTLVGQNLGARDPRRAAHGGWTSLALGGALMTFMGIIFYLLAPQMFRFFCPDPGQQPIIDEGVPVLRLIAFAMPGLASCIVFTSALRGAGDTRVPVLFTWFGFFLLRIPLAYLLTRAEIDLGPLGVYRGFNLGLLGAWLAMFADLLVRGVFFLTRFAGGRWQTMRV